MAYKKGEVTKQLIIKGSKELFLSCGYNKSTYKKIGDYLQINPNLIPYYFSSKKRLAQYVIHDFFDAESSITDLYVQKKYDPMLNYAIHNRIHYRILAQNPGLLLFYSEAVADNLLPDIFWHIHSVTSLYNDFFSYYQPKDLYPSKYYIRMEIASEQEILRDFSPSFAYDDLFINFVSSIFPRMVQVPEENISTSLQKAKHICSNIDLSHFEF